MTHSTAPIFDKQRLREALGHYASGVTVVTGRDHEGPVGFTCQSFYSVSLDPPLVSFSVMKSSTSYPRIRSSGTFAVNVLSDEQSHVSSQFAITGADKWAGVTWTESRKNNPVISRTLMWIDCRTWAEYDAGDHWIVVGQVDEISSPDWHEGKPLLYFRGQYRHLREPDEQS
ncbi:flavin reductase family protein [Nocardia puris]|uniref:flavin reductase family protein n=1 Tax=Nocardia puris TaxID=208602 RepID=UPI002E212DB0